MRTFAAPVLCLALLHAVPLPGQPTPELVPGERIRITAPTLFPRPAIGRLSSLERGVLVFADGQAVEWEVPLDGVERLERSTRRRARIGEGIGLGLLVGAGVGGILGAAAGGSGDLARRDAILLATGFFGAGGLVLGGLVGVVSKKDYWQVVPAEQ